MNAFAEYLASKGIRQADAAVALKCGQGTISRLVNRSMRPSLELATRIEWFTNGSIPASSWIADAEQKGAA